MKKMLVAILLILPFFADSQIFQQSNTDTFHCNDTLTYTVRQMQSIWGSSRTVPDSCAVLRTFNSFELKGSGRGGSPGGVLHSVQYNNPLGTFAGNSNFLYDGTTVSILGTNGIHFIEANQLSSDGNYFYMGSPFGSAMVAVQSNSGNVVKIGDYNGNSNNTLLNIDDGNTQLLFSTQGNSLLNINTAEATIIDPSTNGLYIIANSRGSLEDENGNGVFVDFTGTGKVTFATENANTIGFPNQSGTIMVSTHTIQTPLTGTSVALSSNQINIINPAGSLTSLVFGFPSSPVNNDIIYIKVTQAIASASTMGSTVNDFPSAITAGSFMVFTYDATNTTWY